MFLFKLLYFSDFDNYEIYEKSISGETYIRKRMRPVPSHFTSAIDELIDANIMKNIIWTIDSILFWIEFKYHNIIRRYKY